MRMTIRLTMTMVRQSRSAASGAGGAGVDGDKTCTEKAITGNDKNIRPLTLARKNTVTSQSVGR